MLVDHWVYGTDDLIFQIYDAAPKRRTQQFQFMANGLRTSRLVTYVEKIRQEADMYFRSWSSSGTVSLYKCFCEVTILTASRALLGDEARENLFAEVAKLYSDLDKGTTAFSFFFPYAPIPAHKKRDQARIEMVKLFSKVIHDRREKGVKADDILQTFMDAEYKDAPGSPIPDDHIVGLLIGLLFAGQHTSSSTLTWTLLHIMSNPDILKRVLEEQDQVLGNGKTLSLETLGEMKLLHSCIKESLRLNPPLIFVMRRVMQDINFEQYTIPEGHIVVTSPAVAGKLDESWSDSTKFDPDRFIDGRDEESRKPFTYVAFGGGMHGCMGQQYAYLQIKTVLSVLLRQFSLELMDSQLPAPDYTNLVVIPSGPCNAKFNRRE